VFYLQELAMQPYNFQPWKPGFLAPLGMVNDRVPHQVPIVVEGKFADVTDARISPDLVVELKRVSVFDGMVMRYSMAILPQNVVWSNSAIVQFGDYRRGEVPEGNDLSEVGFLISGPNP
jgi:hypothetical protein